jgi:hypothetical protein
MASQSSLGSEITQTLSIFLNKPLKQFIAAIQFTNMGDVLNMEWAYRLVQDKSKPA